MSNDSNAVQEFLAEGSEILSRISLALSRSDASISQLDLDSLYRDIHTLKGTAQLFGYQKIALLAHACEASLEPVRKRNSQLSAELIEILLKCVDLMETALQNNSLNASELNQVIGRLTQYVTKQISGDSNLSLHDVPPDLNGNLQIVSMKSSPIKLKDKSLEADVHLDEANSNSGSTKDSTSSIRVQTSLLDKLINLVGELVLVRNQVLQHARASEDQSYLNLTQRLDVVTTELQDQAMRTRMQPVGTVFSKFHRTVHDLGRELNKKIDLEISGAETELDKSLIEAVRDPLNHIIRNACDHGIEPTSDRKKAGKNPKGIIKLLAYQEGGQVIIEIQDDGQGIDPQMLARKAIEKGFIADEVAHKMTTQQLQELIFLPGLSTHNSVTSLSGRGVGMDVVKTNLEGVGGSIELSSTVGKGTTIKLQIPLTLAIVPAMVIEANGIHFAIPQIKLQELILIDMELKKSGIEKLQGQLFYRLRGELLPLICLKSVLQTTTQSRSFSSNVLQVAVVRSEAGPYGIIIDSVSESAEIVVKPLPAFLRQLTQYSGATILGNGEVALILDIQGLSQFSKATHKKAAEESALKAESHSNPQGQVHEGEYLVFKLATVQEYVVPLALVHRLEEFNSHDIQESGDESVIPYRGTLLPLLPLAKIVSGTGLNLELIENSKISVFVTNRSNRYFGFIVEEIVDIETLPSEVTPHLSHAFGSLGTVKNSHGKLKTVIDLFQIIDSFSRKDSGVQKKESDKNKLKGRKILYAEDTPFFAKRVQSLLSQTGVILHHALNGREALDRLSNEAFDLVLSDIEMPVMDGFALAQAIRSQSQYSRLPLVALTTKVREIDIQKGKEVGFNRYLEKLNGDDLIHTLAELIGETA